MERVEVRSRNRVHDGKVVRLDVERVALPNGHEVELEIVRHVGAVAVVAVDDAGRVVLVRQYRHATGGYLLEVPAGKLDVAGEAAEACAHRELQEEVGRTAARLEELGWIWTTPGFSDERIRLYLATGLAETSQALQDDEVLSVVALPLGEAVRMALDGEITDAKSAIAILRAAAVWDATASGGAGQRRVLPRPGGSGGR